MDIIQSNAAKIPFKSYQYRYFQTMYKQKGA